MLYVVQSFVNEQLYEECAPLATFESACKVISFEFEENVINHQTFVGIVEPLAGSRKRLHDTSLSPLREPT